jgi:DNA mismatch repair protein MutL
VQDRIQILPENLINQIAAGEVIERPASVVKELVENAIDAGASRIEIEIWGAGKKKISVRDNGCGMSCEDARLSIERHATSKINRLSDLFEVKTLGFRGEALPSIASVSEFKLTTRSADDDQAFEIRLSGGKKKSERPAGAPRGTEGVVENLFFNTPARLKFLKSDGTEMSRIAETVSQLALAWPAVSFLLKNETRTFFNYVSTPSILERILSVLMEKKENFLEVEDRFQTFHLRGFVAVPSIYLSTARGCYTFVNGRPVRDRTILHALLSSYEGAMAHGYYPKAVLYLTCDGNDVDVNAHPTKQEVRFREPQLIHRFIEAGLKKCLNRQIQKLGIQTVSLEPLKGDLSETVFHQRIPARLAIHDAESSPPAAAPQGRPPQGRCIEDGFDQKIFSRYRYIGQLKSSYLLCEDQENLIFIDQHAAHERIAFNRLKKEMENQKTLIQPLLVPVSIELNSEESAWMEEKKPLFEEMGFEIDYFGGGTFLIKAAPQMLFGHVSSQMIRDLLGELKELPRDSKTSTLERLRDQMLSTVACHSARTAHERLQSEEIDALLVSLDQLESPPHCPHGRPFSFSIRISEIEKKFHR